MEPENTALPYRDSVIYMALHEKHGRYEVHYTQKRRKKSVKKRSLTIAWKRESEKSV